MGNYPPPYSDISFIDILLLIVDDQDKRKSKEEKKLSNRNLRIQI